MKDRNWYTVTWKVGEKIQWKLMWEAGSESSILLLSYSVPAAHAGFLNTNELPCLAQLLWNIQ